MVPHFATDRCAMDSSDTDRKDAYTEEACAAKMRVKQDYTDGALVYSIPTNVFVVLEEFIHKVCSCCLKVHLHNQPALKRCSKCCFVRYCSIECQAKDWTLWHKRECVLMEQVSKVCPDQSSDFARFFVRSALKIVDNLKKAGIHHDGGPPLTDEQATHFFQTYCHPSNSKALFKRYDPLLAAIDSQFDTKFKNFTIFMGTLCGIAQGIQPICCSKFSAENAPFDVPNIIIAYANFRHGTSYPKCKRNAVYLPVVDSVNGPTLQIKAVTPLKIGEELVVGTTTNLLTNAPTLFANRVFPLNCELCRNEFGQAWQKRLEPKCVECDGRADITEVDMGQSDIAIVGCVDRRCWFAENPVLYDFMTDTIAELTSVNVNENDSPETKLLAQQKELGHMVSAISPMVGPTSFALGILHRELASVYEKLGQMDECVESYKVVISVAEKHLDKYDQNIFDGLSRIIVFHLEGNEVAESLPYIEKAWERLQKVPGKDSFDFFVVGKLRTAVKAGPLFSFSDFCSVVPR